MKIGGWIDSLIRSLIKSFCSLARSLETQTAAVPSSYRPSLFLHSALIRTSLSSTVDILMYSAVSFSKWQAPRCTALPSHISLISPAHKLTTGMSARQIFKANNWALIRAPISCADKYNTIWSILLSDWTMLSLTCTDWLCCVIPHTTESNNDTQFSKI